MAYYLWSRGRILPSKAYEIMNNKKGEYKLLKAFAEMEMEEEKERLELKIAIAKAGMRI